MIHIPYNPKLVQSLCDHPIFKNTPSAKEIDRPRIFFAPGRINFIGEHTDYNGGWVMPGSLKQGTYIAIQPQRKPEIEVVSFYLDRHYTIPIHEIQPPSKPTWYDYLLGCVQSLEKMGTPWFGFRAVIHGDLPVGAGLSSSASLLLAVLLALHSNNPSYSSVTESSVTELDRLAMIKQAHRVEREWIGVQCGIMDHFAAGLGKAGHLSKLHCDTLQYEYTPFQTSSIQLLITNSNVQRRLSHSEYNTRVAECQTALRQIHAIEPKIQSLSDITIDHWNDLKPYIADPIVRKRAEHVIHENERVHRCFQALNQKDFSQVGHILNDSHASLKDNYAVTGEFLDHLVHTAQTISGVYGSRMTGAGFGGCTITLVENDAVSEVITILRSTYHERFNITPSFLQTELGDGMMEVGNRSTSRLD